MDEYRFPGFRPKARIQGMFGDPKARVIKLLRTQKKQYADAAALSTEVSMTRRCGLFGISPVEMQEFIWRRMYGGSCVEGATK